MTNIKVILADDHAVFRRSVASFLQCRQGVEIVSEAQNGEEVVTQAARHRPDLVLMDMKMPKQDGFEATRCIKRDSPLTKVVMLTFNANSLYETKGKECGIDGFINKGSVKQALMQLLDNLVASPQQAAA